MILVNGCNGIGSCWSTNVPNFNPIEISYQLRKKLLYDADFEELVPWYKGFAGEIALKADGNY